MLTLQAASTRLMVCAIVLMAASPAIAAVFYVDANIADMNVASLTPDCSTYDPNAHTCGAGSANAFRSLEDVHAYLDLAAQDGDEIYFRRGQSWIFNGNAAEDPHGTDWFADNIAEGILSIEDQNITIGAFGSGDRPFIAGGETWSAVSPWGDGFSASDSIILIGRNGNADGATIQDLELKDYGGRAITIWDKSNITIQRMKVTYMGDMFIRCLQGNLHNIEVLNNEAGYLGHMYVVGWTPYATMWANGISLQSCEPCLPGGYDITVRGNYIYKVMGEGMGIPFSYIDGTHQSIVEYNVVMDTSAPPIHASPKAWDAGRLRVRYNIVIHTGDEQYKHDPGGHYAPGIYVMDEYHEAGDNSHADVEYYGNTYIHWGNNVKISGPGGSWNKFWIYNNTFIQPRNFSISVKEGTFSGPAFTDFRYFNNAHIRYEGITNKAHVWEAVGDSDHSGCTIKNNHFFPYAGVGAGINQVDEDWDADIVTGDPSLPGETRANPVDWDNLTNGLADLSFNDIYPPSNSVLVDSGMDPGPAFESKFLINGTSFTGTPESFTWVLGSQSSAGSAWDIGAYISVDTCLTSWVCTEWSWSVCSAGQQTGTRICMDDNICGTDINRPPETQLRGCGEVGLAAHWKMDAADNTGATMLDSSGNQRDAIVHGAPQETAGSRCEALKFNGTNDYLETDFREDLPQWTVSLWLKGDADPGDDRDTGPVMKQENFVLAWDHRTPAFRSAAGLSVEGTWYPASFGMLEGGRWYHLVASYDGETLRAYTDGVLITENTAPSGPADSSAHTLTIAKHAVSDSFFAGSIDDLKVYEMALLPDEIVTSICLDCDRDGYGDPPDHCLRPEKDCDDARAQVYPSAEEVCNGIDDNCDNITDEGFDLGVDPHHCGRCNHSCGNGQVCEDGRCLSNQGAECVDPDDCRSGFCVSGVCCEGPCSQGRCDFADHEGECLDADPGSNRSASGCSYAESSTEGILWLLILVAIFPRSRKIKLVR